MTLAEIKKVLNSYDTFDGEILEHGFTKNSRDYRIVIDIMDNKCYEFFFVGCVELIYKNVLPEQELSFDEVQPVENVNYECVDFSVLYPGIEIVDISNISTYWSKRFKKEFHHIKIKTNVFELEIIFNSINVKKLETV